MPPPLLADIIVNLVSSTIRERKITNSDLELAALILHEAILSTAVPDARLAAPFSGSNNPPAVFWSTKEALTVVVDFLCLCAVHSKQFFINPFHFFHPVIKNRMANDAYCLFDLSDTSLLAHMYAAYPQTQISWKLSLPTPDMLSYLIFTLRRKPCKQELHKMISSRSYTSSRVTSAPPSISILISKIHPSFASRSSNCTVTASDTLSTTRAELTNLVRS